MSQAYDETLSNVAAGAVGVLAVPVIMYLDAWLLAWAWGWSGLAAVTGLHLTTIGWLVLALFVRVLVMVGANADDTWSKGKGAWEIVATALLRAVVSRLVAVLVLAFVVWLDLGPLT